MSVTFYTEKEPLVTKLVSQFIEQSDSYKIRIYEPNLTAFDIHVTNKWKAIVSCINDSMIRVLTIDSWRKYCYGTLRAILHTNNYKLYQRAGYPTDSPHKIIRMVFGELEIERWLLDICREISRPMAKGRVIYVPFLRFVEGKGRAADPKLHWLSMSLAQSQIVRNGMRNSELCAGWNETESYRAVVEEDLMIAPLGVVDGEYFFIDRETATWRKRAFYMLGSLRNGAVIPAATYGSAAEHGEVWTPTFITRDAAEEEGLLFQDSYELGAQFAVPENMQLEAYRASSQGLPFNIDGVNYLLMYFTVDRDQVYNNWLLRLMASETGIPEIDNRIQAVPRLIEVEKRFPSLDAHSKTPNPNDPQSTIRLPTKAKVRRSLKKRKDKADNQGSAVKDDNASI